ncbi:MAG: UDP-N-acetylmuramate dehydrogenase [Thermoflexaceae bacterium]|nr:UDP-N-acetylmuramate dehydrogenase [Thermoflexaceae bacterium]
MNQDIFDRLVQIAGKDNVLVNESMKKHTTFRIGGPADFFVTPCSALQTGRLICECRQMGIPYYVMGNGSNLLVSDNGYRGVIIQIYDKLNEIEWQEDGAVVMAGCLLSRFGNEAAKKGLTGFEFATGIPGTMGGAVAMNAGAYGGEIADCIVRARMMDVDGAIRWYEKDELELGYRMSAAIKHNLIVLEAEIKLAKGNTEEIKKKLADLSAARKSKQPLEYPSAGSTFKRPEGYFAGKLIQDAGFKGFSHGGAMVSDKHSGFVINVKDATAEDVMAVINAVSDGVYEKFGVRLEMEVKRLGDF